MWNTVGLTTRLAQLGLPCAAVCVCNRSVTLVLSTSSAALCPCRPASCFPATYCLQDRRGRRGRLGAQGIPASSLVCLCLMEMSPYQLGLGDEAGGHLVSVDHKVGSRAKPGPLLEARRTSRGAEKGWDTGPEGAASSSGCMAPKRHQTEACVAQECPCIYQLSASTSPSAWSLGSHLELTHYGGPPSDKDRYLLSQAANTIKTGFFLLRQTL